MWLPQDYQHCTKIALGGVYQNLLCVLAGDEKHTSSAARRVSTSVVTTRLSTLHENRTRRSVSEPPVRAGVHPVLQGGSGSETMMPLDYAPESRNQTDTDHCALQATAAPRPYASGSDEQLQGLMLQAVTRSSKALCFRQ